MTKPRRRQAGEGGISAYKTTAGTRYLTKYPATLEDGTRKVFLKRGHATRADAARYLREKLADVDRGNHIAPQRMTVGQWFDQWTAGLRLAPSTEASYRKNIRLHLKPALGGIQLQRLTGARITAMYRAMEASGRMDYAAGQGLAPRTVRYCHTILRRALADAVEEGLLPHNPADKAKPPTVNQSKAPEMHPWTGAQLAAFLRWAWDTNGPHAPAWHVLAYTGMRRGELLGLRWRDVDLERGAMSVRRSVGVVKVEGRGKTLIEGPTKGKRARVIDLDPSTVDVLRRWRVELGGLALQLVRDDALVFGNLEGLHQHPERFSARFVEKQAQCLQQFGVDGPPRIKLHDLRHTHATLLLQAGIPVKVVSERLGHASVTITLETYAHVMPGMQAEAAAAFAAAVQGGA